MHLNKRLRETLCITSSLFAIFHDASLWGSTIWSPYFLIEVALWKMKNNEEAVCEALQAFFNFVSEVMKMIKFERFIIVSNVWLALSSVIVTTLE